VSGLVTRPEFWVPVLAIFGVTAVALRMTAVNRRVLKQDTMAVGRVERDGDTLAVRRGGGAEAFCGGGPGGLERGGRFGMRGRCRR